MEGCVKYFEPSCGKFAGVAAILNEARRFIIDSEAASESPASLYGNKSDCEETPRLSEGSLICIYSFSGGLGTSCSAIGIGRELARYRSEQVMYLSLEDAEDACLFPSGLCAMRAEEALYRYLRLLNIGAGREGFVKLFRAAAARDEYGLYRLAPDECAGSLASLAPEELYSFLYHASASLGLSRIVLDLGTRINFLKVFAQFSGLNETLFIEIRANEDDRIRNMQALFTGEQQLTAAFPVCDDDIRSKDGLIDVGLANAFGLAVKELCDSITGDAP